MTKIHEIIPAIQTLTRDYFPELVGIRRHLHRHPELSGREILTAQYLAGKLTQLGYHIHMPSTSHGLWADLTSDPSKPSVALRVDIDALPIQEVNQAPYRSILPGVMHACGHDVHAAIGIGVAAVLAQLRSTLPGNIRLIFQPEEEEITGAVRMIRAGALARPTPEAIFGLHVAPLPAGQVAWTDGLFLAGFEHYLVSLAPQRWSQRPLSHIDAVAGRCCRVIQRFNRWQLPETWDAMQDFWKLMQTGPDSLRRFFVYDAAQNDTDPAAWRGQFGLGIKAANPHLRIAAIGRVRAALNTICRATGTRYRLEAMGAMIDMINNKALVRASLPALSQALGAENLRHLKAAFPFNCEDFAYYTQRVPGAMFWLGAADPAKGKFAILHTPDFDVDERCIETGTVAMAALLVNALYQSGV
jgi:metal-dependent amidase/aminoacylase/carboxypeptidase family protein